MLILKENEVCQLAQQCPHNDTTKGCYGARANRAYEFTCEFVQNGKIITDSGFRNPLDQTGKMKVIME